jgi:hypothetical protein
LVPVPRLTSPFIVALRERGPTAIHSRRPRSGRVSDQETDPEIRPEDHIPNKNQVAVNPINTSVSMSHATLPYFLYHSY